MRRRVFLSFLKASSGPIYVSVLIFIFFSRMLYKEEGARGYFRGLVPGLLGTAHGAVQFMTYEEIIYRMKQLQEDSTAPLPSPYFMVAGSLSKAVAAGITYPYQVSHCDEKFPFH